MGDVTSISLEETNRIRASLGLKTIPNPDREAATNDKGNHSTKSRFSKSVRIEKNGSHLAIESEPTRGQKIDELKHKIEQSKNSLTASLIDEQDDDPDWLSKVGTPVISDKASTASTFKPAQNGDAAVNSPLRLSEEVISQVKEKPIILTFKDTHPSNSADGEDHEEVLINEDYEHEKQDAKNIRLRQLNQERKLNKVSIFDQEEQRDGDPLTTVGPLMNDTLSTAKLSRLKRIESESDGSEDQGDYAPIKIKKRKKKSEQKSKLKQKTVDVSTMVKVDLLDDYEDGDIDEFEQPNIKIQPKSQKVTANNDQPSQVVLEKYELTARNRGVHLLDGMSKEIIMDDTEDFLNSLKTDILQQPKEVSERIKIDLKQVQQHKDVVQNQIASTELPKIEEDASNIDFSGGVASMLNFLKDRNILKQNEHAFSAAKRRGVNIQEEFQSLSKIAETSRTIQDAIQSKNVTLSAAEQAKIKTSQEEQIASQLQKLQQEKLRDYDPKVDVTYKDSQGNELTPKEAYKQLSQAWHGTKSSEKTKQRQQRRILERKKQQEHQSLLNP